MRTRFRSQEVPHGMAEDGTSTFFHKGGVVVIFAGEGGAGGELGEGADEEGRGFHDC